MTLAYCFVFKAFWGARRNKAVNDKILCYVNVLLSSFGSEFFDKKFL